MASLFSFLILTASEFLFSSFTASCASRTSHPTSPSKHIPHVSTEPPAMSAARHGMTTTPKQMALSLILNPSFLFCFEDSLFSETPQTYPVAKMIHFSLLPILSSLSLKEKERRLNVAKRKVSFFSFSGSRY
jgi:hypothetical protein